ncbi:DNA methyltransferase [Lacinutrix salivirga]
MKLYDVLENQLKKVNDFVSDTNQLKKWVVIHKAQNFDPVLLELLLDNKDLKEKFFIKIKDALVFNQNLFIQFLEQKNYLNDSYTQYKNKVGLTVNQKYLKQNNDVALVWPFKDCVLEGGQSTEEDKRDEIFFNEILAQDEITQLLEPKVLTNAKCFSKDTVESLWHSERSEESLFSRNLELNKKRNLPKNTITDNLIIKGNNLLALHSIKKEFTEKVKLIYIDPPYNTGGDANIFTYNNTFNHSTWLTFMKNRLTIAKTLLKQDGFIAIAIDHYELGYLITLADEIFGQENRIGIISVVNNPMGRNQAKYFSTVNDFMLIYAKNNEFATFNNVVLNDEFLKTFDKEDQKGKYKLKQFIRVGGGNANLKVNKPTFWYPLYVSKDLKNITLHKTDNTIEVFPITATGQKRTWKLSKKSTEQKLDELIAVKNKDESITIFEKYRIEKGQKVPTVWSDKKYNANHNGIRLLEKIIGRKNFSFPKSIYTVLDTIKLMSGPNDIILDFHAGSGTTGHAVLELNKVDNGNRKFILVEQLNDHINICIERNQNVLQQNNLKDTFVYFELKKYNQNFIDRIKEATSKEDLLSIWEEMKAKSFLNYNVDLKKQNENIDAFNALELQFQKQHLISLLDKNQLYVNVSSINDSDYKVSEEDKKITNSFYN